MTGTGGADRQLLRHVVAESADVLIVNADARMLAVALGFSEVEAEEIGIVARELATNIIKHAGHGSMTLVSEHSRLVIEAEDAGPGIPDVDQALADGYSTAGSLGYGLGTVNRLMDHVEITSRTGRGTRVLAHRTVRVASERAMRPPVEVGIATLPKPGYAENGDGYLFCSWGANTMVGVLDGVGHGAPAQAATQAALRYIETHLEQPMEDIFRGVGIACRGTRGVVMALARFDWAAQTLEFASVGNIEARVFDTDEPMRFVVRRGILGANAPEPRVTSQPWPVGASLVLFSDGVASHWGDATLADAQGSNASIGARALLNRLNRQTDDATLLIVRPLSEPVQS